MRVGMGLFGVVWKEVAVVMGWRNLVGKRWAEMDDVIWGKREALVQG